MENETELLKNELKNINNKIEIEKNNLIYMLKHINIENINLMNFHYKLSELIIKRDNLENRIYNNKFKEV